MLTLSKQTDKNARILKNFRFRNCIKHFQFFDLSLENIVYPYSNVIVTEADNEAFAEDIDVSLRVTFGPFHLFAVIIGYVTLPSRY